MIIIGFTGTQRGMTDAQKNAFNVFMKTQLEIYGRVEFHHGDCVGADEDAHNIATSHGIEPVLHPPIDPKKRAYCISRNIHKPKPFHERNHDIVDGCGVLVATPGGTHEILRSGTWSTVRYARKRNRHYIIINPDGTTTHYLPQNNMGDSK